MRCGEKCFLVTIEKNGEQQKLELAARSSTEARKKLRSTYGEEVKIVAVTPEKKH